MSYHNESLREYFSILRSLYHSVITGVCEFGCTSDRTLYNWNMALSNWFRYFTLTIFMCDKRSKHGLLQSLFINSITKKLPSVFNHYFTTVNEIHAYNTRLASKNLIHCPKPELISESSTLDTRDLKFGISWWVWQKLLYFQLKKKLKTWYTLLIHIKYYNYFN